MARGLFQDVHKRFRTEAHQHVVKRFNERFILSLSSCKSCLVVDDELNVLPISKHARNLVPLEGVDAASGTKEAPELTELKASLEDTELVRPPRPPLTWSTPSVLTALCGVAGGLARSLVQDSRPSQGNADVRRGYFGEVAAQHCCTDSWTRTGKETT